MKPIVIPKRKIERWYFIKQAGESNAQNIARFFCNDEEAAFVLYSDLFYALYSTNHDQSSADYRKLHNLIMKSLIERIAEIYGNDVSEYVNKLAFYYI